MKKLSKLEKILKVFVYIITPFVYMNAPLIPIKNPNIKFYIEKNLNEIIKEQEEVLNIKHFGVPTIVVKPEDFEHNNIFSGVRLGYYSNDTIYINSTLEITVPNSKLNNILGDIFFFGHTSNIKEILDHELGHYYVDKLKENLNINKELDTNLIKIGMKLISEGIAEYFKNKIYKKDLKKYNLVKSVDDMKYGEFYNCGYHLVKPVIDRHGKKGIEYLIANPPTNEDLEQLLQYQNRTLENLEQNVKK